MHLSGWPGEMANKRVLPPCVLWHLCVILGSLQQITRAGSWFLPLWCKLAAVQLLQRRRATCKQAMIWSRWDGRETRDERETVAPGQLYPSHVEILIKPICHDKYFSEHTNTHVCFCLIARVLNDLLSGEESGSPLCLIQSANTGSPVS